MQVRSQEHEESQVQNVQGKRQWTKARHSEDRRHRAQIDVTLQWQGRASLEVGLGLATRGPTSTRHKQIGKIQAAKGS